MCSECHETIINHTYLGICQTYSKTVQFAVWVTTKVVLTRPIMLLCRNRLLGTEWTTLYSMAPIKHGYYRIILYHMA